MNKRNYKIRFKKSVLKDFKKLPTAVVERLKSEIQNLREEPVPSQAHKLQGYKNIYRLRVGSYRVIYELENEIKIITVIKIGHRKDVYQQV